MPALTVRSVTALLVLAGCNQVLGLDETVPRGADSDEDGLPNANDNCPVLANEDQADADGDQLGDVCDPCPLGPESNVDEDRDGVDDACDPCPLGRQHDEDGDGVFDGCDNCPAQANDQQTNSDGDELGDVCDPDNARAHRRVLFDGFDTVDSHWKFHQIWESVSDQLIPIPEISSSYTLEDATLAMNADGWRFELGATIPTNGYFGLHPGHRFVDECSLIGSGTMWMLNGAQVSRHVTLALGSRVTLRFSKVGPVAARQQSCELAGEPALLAPATGTDPVFPSIFSTASTAQLDYLDVVE